MGMEDYNMRECSYLFMTRSTFFTVASSYSCQRRRPWIPLLETLSLYLSCLTCIGLHNFFLDRAEIFLGAIENVASKMITSIRPR